jgi:biopolymer transport protein TolQ
MNDVMPVYLAVVAQAGEEPPSLMEMILTAEPIIQLVLLMLVAMSVTCWAIIASKARTVRRAAQQSEDFLELFWKSRRLDHVYEQLGEFPHAPVAHVFKAGYVELSKLTNAQQQGADKAGITMGGSENLERSMRRARSMQISALERMVPFLATTGATAPFIGLFGTVWGILRAFQRIGESGQASIQVVGPDIANALVATAVGLVAAIPAVMAFNYFNTRIRVVAGDMENFSSDFMNIVKRHFRGL